MRLQDFLIKQPMVKRYTKKYTAPLIAYKDLVPDSYMNAWWATGPAPEEVALYFVGVLNRPADSMPNILVFAERHKNYKIPLTEGILTTHYWQTWFTENLVECLEALDSFIYAGQEGAL